MVEAEVVEEPETSSIKTSEDVQEVAEPAAIAEPSVGVVEEDISVETDEMVVDD